MTVMQNKSNLWIFGDSYSVIYHDDTDSIWQHLVAQDLDCNLNVYSKNGVAQDWIFHQIESLRDKISADDYVVIILTDPSRFWFFEERPDLSNSWIADLEKHIGAQKSKIIGDYIKYIQRPSLDIQKVAQRLGWLNNLVGIKKWRKPAIIRGFPQFIQHIEDYNNLIISKDNLFEISCAEWSATKEVFGVDPRYNHLCISNHKVLSKKIFSAFNNEEFPDFKSEFLSNILSDEKIKDLEFCEKELSLYNLALYNSTKNTPRKQTFMEKYIFNNKD